MQLAAQPLLHHHRPTALAAMRMLSSTSVPNIGINPTKHAAMRPTSTTDPASCVTTNLALFSNPRIAYSNSQNFSHILTPCKCFSSSSAMNATPISSPFEPKVEKPRASNDFIADSPLVVVSFYKFADFPDHADLRKPLKKLCEGLSVSGGIILAPEGINGSICGTRDSVENVLAFIQKDDRQGVFRLFGGWSHRSVLRRNLFITDT